MFHKPKQLRMIETWSGWLAWLYILSLGINILILVSFALNDNEQQLSFEPFLTLFWMRIVEINSYLSPIFVMIAKILFLFGISKAVRFLRTYYAQITAGD